MGSGVDGQRVPGRPGRDHLSLLLGRPRRRVSPRNRRRHRRGLGHRPARISAHRRSDRRGSGSYDRRNLGHAVLGSLRGRQIRRADRRLGADTSTRRHRPLLWRRIRRAEGADDRQLLDHDRDLRRLDGADVRGQVRASGCASRPRARSKDSTCTSTASRPIPNTWSPARTAAPRRSTTCRSAGAPCRVLPKPRRSHRNLHSARNETHRHFYGK